jgi:hypothetical protein
MKLNLNIVLFCILFLKHADEDYFNDENSHWLLRPKLMFHEYRYVYYSAMVLNTIMRFIWVVSLIPMPSSSDKSYSTYDIIYPFLGVIEQCRRAMWGMLRIEWEHVKVAEKAKLLEHIPSEIDSFDAPMHPSVATHTRYLSNYVPFDLSPVGDTHVVTAARIESNLVGPVCHIVAGAVFVSGSILLLLYFTHDNNLG